MTRKQKRELARILVSAALLVAAWLLPLPKAAGAAIYLVAYAAAGWDVVWSAVRNILHGQLFDEQFLMALATAGAIALGDFREAVAVMVFYQVGEWFQGVAVGRSRRNIAGLMDIRPDTAVAVRGGEEITVSPDDVQVGEEIIVRPGEKVPLDGVISSGSTTLNTAALTGESLPRDAAAGDRVVSGSINLTGVIRIRTESTFGESTVSKILELVENASEKKAKVENFITRFSRVYTPVVVCAAVLLAVLPPLLSLGSWGEWVNRALIFLVVSCPCALVVSVPLSFFGGIGGASREGILIKGAGYMETLSNARVAVFDKTGTLTRGTFSVTAIHPAKATESEILDLAAAAECNSTHPIALSILAAHDGHIDKARISSVTEVGGKGIRAVIDGRDIYVGNGKLMDEAGAAWHPCHKPGTVIHLSEGGVYLGHIVISDELKPGAAEAIRALKDLGVSRTVMLTGDGQVVADAVAAETGVDEVHAELLPGDKVDRVERLLAQGTVLFVGDGINDAPVLARADVGVAMGALGSDAAIEAADVVLMDDDPRKLPRAIRIARKTMGIVRQNIVFALAVKAVVLTLGAVGIANMWLAVFADVGVLVLAILNAMRALRIKK